MSTFDTLPPNPEKPDPSGDDARLLQETMAILSPEGQSEAATLKQESDLAFVVALVRSGRINERQIARALDGWTIYGTQAVADRVVDQKLITEQERDVFLEEARKRLDTAGKSATQDGSRDSSLITRAKIAHLDTSGRLSRIIGLNNSGVLASANDSRQVFSRFSLIRKLGEGGLGTVWLARDENLRRYVAIKEIRSSRLNPSEAAIARFRREAEITGRLEHPGIVPIYQFGTDSDTGHFFYVMRFLGKHTMHDAILEYHERREAGADEPLLMHRLLASFVKLCYSVAHAHSRHVVHRDLKPENVALDNFGEVVLLDWGLAKINDESGAADAALELDDGAMVESNLTMASQVLGSPMYMAPEQAAGRLDEIDERTDVYGLGGILFAILTGHAPHEHSRESTSENASMSDLLQSIVASPVSRARELNASIPPELDAICFKAMQKKRFLRYSEAEDIAEDVERFMAGDKVSAYNEPWRRQAKRWIAAHPKLSQVGGVLGTLLLITMAVVGYSLRQTQIAETTFRYQQGVDVAKELVFHLQSQAEHVVRDSRFLATLPPVQPIIQAESRATLVSMDSGFSGDLGEDVPPSIPLQSDDTWMDRMSDVVEGLLEGNESYLSIALVQVTGAEIKQLLRAERSPGTNVIRRVPNSLLSSFAISESSPNYSSLLPGDVILQTSDNLSESAPTTLRDSLSLTAISAIFNDDTGELFGLLAIQVDLRGMIRERLEATGKDDSMVYITNGKGVIELAYQQGQLAKSGVGRPIVDVIKEVETIFRDNSAINEYADNSQIFGTRFLLGDGLSKSEAELGIAVQVSQ